MDHVERLILAYSMHVVRAIADADGVLDWAEIQAISARFPEERLREAGFLDQGRFTGDYDDAVEEARLVLGDTLTLQQKLDMVTGFREALVADGEVAPAEVGLLSQAARELGIPRQALKDHLRRLKNG